MTKANLLLVLLFLLPSVQVTGQEFNDLQFADSESFLTTDARWIFKSETKLPVSLEACWNIITDNGAWEFWHPEVINIQDIGNQGDPDYQRTVDFVDEVIPQFSLFETFDVWESTGDVRRRYSFWFEGVTLPPFISFRRGREDFVCEVNIEDPNQSVFTRTVAVDPGFGARMISFLIRRRLETVFNDLCPTRLLNSIAAGDLPRLP